MKLSPRLASDALVDDDGEAERGGEAERDRDHQRQRREDAPQQQDQDHEDHPGSDRKDEEHVAVDGVAHVGKGSGLAADESLRADPPGSGVRGIAQGALGQIERLVREWARLQAGRDQSGPPVRTQTRGSDRGDPVDTPEGVADWPQVLDAERLVAGDVHLRRVERAGRESGTQVLECLGRLRVGSGASLGCRSRRCSGARWRRARAAPRPKRWRRSTDALRPTRRGRGTVSPPAPSATPLRARRCGGRGARGSRARASAQRGRPRVPR